jgi:hypothetical protein
MEVPFLATSGDTDTVPMNRVILYAAAAGLLAAGIWLIVLGTQTTHMVMIHSGTWVSPDRLGDAGVGDLPGADIRNHPAYLWTGGAACAAAVLALADIRRRRPPHD